MENKIKELEAKIAQLEKDKHDLWELFFAATERAELNDKDSHKWFTEYCFMREQAGVWMKQLGQAGINPIMIEQGEGT